MVLNNQPQSLLNYYFLKLSRLPSPSKGPNANAFLLNLIERQCRFYVHIKMFSPKERINQESIKKANTLKVMYFLKEAELETSIMGDYTPVQLFSFSASSLRKTQYLTVLNFQRNNFADEYVKLNEIHAFITVTTHAHYFILCEYMSPFYEGVITIIDENPINERPSTLFNNAHFTLSISIVNVISSTNIRFVVEIHTSENPLESR
ncbi:hypothetical protein H8356DRAFT_1360373 [Neocallimastix lanati (nom. inval.)]|nr:hypothetical protein H8356DRAFT_1360373 [Neocallimastix sp. JGI-2020a]